MDKAAYNKPCTKPYKYIPSPTRSAPGGHIICWPLQKVKQSPLKHALIQRLRRLYWDNPCAIPYMRGRHCAVCPGSSWTTKHDRCGPQVQPAGALRDPSQKISGTPFIRTISTWVTAQYWSYSQVSILVSSEIQPVVPIYRLKTISRKPKQQHTA